MLIKAAFGQKYNKNSNIAIIKIEKLLIQSSVSHDPSEIILICRFAA